MFPLTGVGIENRAKYFGGSTQFGFGCVNSRTVGVVPRIGTFGLVGYSKRVPTGVTPLCPLLQWVKSQVTCLELELGVLRQFLNGVWHEERVYMDGFTILTLVWRQQ